MDPPGHRPVDVFFWDGTKLKNITQEITGFAPSASSNQLLLNQKGQVAFVGAQAFRFSRDLNLNSIRRDLSRILPPARALFLEEARNILMRVFGTVQRYD